MTIFAKETIKKLAQEAALQFATAEQCNPFVDNPDAAALFKKYFEIEIAFMQLETAAERPRTNAISTTAAQDIKQSFATVTVSGWTA